MEPGVHFIIAFIAIRHRGELLQKPRSGSKRHLRIVDLHTVGFHSARNKGKRPMMDIVASIRGIYVTSGSSFSEARKGREKRWDKMTISVESWVEKCGERGEMKKIREKLSQLISKNYAGSREVEQIFNLIKLIFVFNYSTHWSLYSSNWFSVSLIKGSCDSSLLIYFLLDWQHFKPWEKISTGSHRF